MSDSDGEIRRGSNAENIYRPHACTDPSHDANRKPPSKSWLLIGRPIVCLLCGFALGFAMEKARAFEPRLIRKQMVLNKFVMVKMFVAALATGLFGMSVLAMIPRTHRSFMVACSAYYNKLADKGLLSSIVGGTLLGVGITMSGSCPLSIFAQIGAFVPNSAYTLAGALTGTLVYSVLKSRIDRLIRPEITGSSNPWLNSPYFVMALPLVAMFGITVCAVELLLPWSLEIKQKNSDQHVLAVKAWPPYMSGIIIGSLQVPLILCFGETLGSSSSLPCVMSQLLIGPFKKLSPMTSRFGRGFSNWVQVLCMCGVIGGAYGSASLSGSLGKSKGVPVRHAFIGGFLIFLGAQVAGGGTSGHGLSGMGFLSIISFLVIAAMCCGAALTGYFMQAMDHLKMVS